MANLLDMLRMRNIFGGNPPVNDMPSQGGFGGEMGGGELFPSPQTPFERTSFLPNTDIDIPELGFPGPAERTRSRINEIYQPQSEATDKFNELIGGYPEREKPGWGRALLGMLTAIGGNPEGGQFIVNQPHQEKLDKWKSLIGPSQQAANLERQENVNQRTLAYQTVSQELRAEADVARNMRDEKKAEIAQQRANVYEFKARNPNMRFDFSGPEVLAADPVTGQISKTGIMTGALSDADKAALGQENALERITKSGEEARKTKQTIPGKAPGEIKSPTQRQIEQTRVKEVLLQHPEWTEYIKAVPGGGGVTVDTGDDEELRQTILDSLDTSREDIELPTNERNLDKEAEDYLRKNGKPVTPANVAYIKSQLGKK